MLWNTLKSDLKRANNLLNFKKPLTKNCKAVEQVWFSKGTTVNMNKDLDALCISSYCYLTYLKSRNDVRFCIRF